MVNNLNPRLLVFGACQIRSTGDGREKIDNGPVYDLAIVKQLVSRHGVFPMTNRSDNDMASAFVPMLDRAELAELVMCLNGNDHFIESERDVVRAGMLVDADAYRILWHRIKRAECKRTGLPVFVKFGFRESNPNCIIVSIHPAKY